jgi:hypothetical protein
MYVVYLSNLLLIHPPLQYYGYHYDPNMPPQFWPGQPPSHVPPQPPTQPTPQQTPMQLHPVPPTPSQPQVPISPRPSPAISLNNAVPPTPSTPSMHTPTIAGSRLQSNAPPFQPQNKRTFSVSLRGPDGAPLDIKALAAAKKDEDASKVKKEDGPAISSSLGDPDLFVWRQKRPTRSA